MRIIRNVNACPTSARGSVLALGNFDGVHVGHQAILQEAVKLGRAQNAPAAAMTFEPHPREFFSRQQPSAAAPLRIESLRQKIEHIREQGIGILFLIRFTQDFAATSAEDFIDELLVKNLSIRHVITGDNFAFGRKRQGDTVLLQSKSKSHAFGFSTLSPVKNGDGQIVSSSAIRDALSNGDMAQASRMLGRAYEICGFVRRGEQRGRKLGFQTANISLQSLFRPKFGVYAGTLIDAQNQSHKAVMNIGINPMFPLAEPLLEVHALDFQGDLYGQRIRVQPQVWLRGEQKFNTVELLQAQMALDCKQAREFLSGAQHA